MTGAVLYHAGVGTLNSDSNADKSKIYIVNDGSANNGKYMVYDSLSATWKYSDKNHIPSPDIIEAAVNNPVFMKLFKE